MNYFDRYKKLIKSFTLAEIIVAIVIMSIFFGVLIASLWQHLSILETTRIIDSFQKDARMAIIKISKDIRQTIPEQITINKDTPYANTDQIVYHLPTLYANSAPIYNDTCPAVCVPPCLQWDTANAVSIMVDAGNPGRLIRTDAAGTTVIAENVSGILFVDRFQNPNLYRKELKITVKFATNAFGSQAHTYNSTTSINMRNYDCAE